jgi:xanthosine utilization system XapX-like protein
MEKMRLVLSVGVIAGALFALGTLPVPAQTTIPAGALLRIQVDRRYRVRSGTRIEGRLIAAIYSVDHKLLPADTRA